MLVAWFLLATALCLAGQFPFWAWFLVAVMVPMLGACLIETLADWET